MRVCALARRGLLEDSREMSPSSLPLAGPYPVASRAYLLETRNHSSIKVI